MRVNAELINWAVSEALALGDRIHVLLTPERCLGGIPTKGQTDSGPYRLILEFGRRRLDQPLAKPRCRASDLIAIAQEGGVEGLACSGTCSLCNRQVWATNGAGNQVTNSGWTRAAIP